MGELMKFNEVLEQLDFGFVIDTVKAKVQKALRMLKVYTNGTMIDPYVIVSSCGVELSFYASGHDLRIYVPYNTDHVSWSYGDKHNDHDYGVCSPYQVSDETLHVLKYFAKEVKYD